MATHYDIGGNQPGHDFVLGLCGQSPDGAEYFVWLALDDPVKRTNVDCPHCIEKFWAKFGEGAKARPIIDE